MSQNHSVSHAKAYNESHCGATYGRGLTYRGRLSRRLEKGSKQKWISTESDAMKKHYTMDEVDKCSKIQVFIKPHRDSDTRSYRPYVGIPAQRSIRGVLSKSSYVYEAYGGQMFGAKPKRIPSGFRLATQNEMVEMGFSPFEIRKTYCTRPRDIQRDLEEGVPARYLTAVANQNGHCLSIRDVSSMQTGTCKDVVLLDRNWMDVACDAHKGVDGVVPAEDFLMMNRVRICRSNNKSLLEFTLTPHEGEGTFGSAPMQIELHVEYAPGRFYPLRNGVIPANDEQTGRQLIGKDVPWTDMSPHARVGWRGPMVLWEVVRHMEPLFCVS